MSGMKIINLILFVVVMVLWSFACSQNDVRTVSSIDHNKGIRLEYSVLNDSVLHGEFREYYVSSGKLKSKGRYQHGCKDGTWLEYDSLGRLFRRIEYKCNKKDGYFCEFYTNGNKLHESFWVDDRQFGPSKWYYPDEQLEILAHYDFAEDAFSVLEFDSIGQVIRNDGMVFSPAFKYSHGIDSVFIGSSLKIDIAITQVPQCESIIAVGLFYDDLDTLKVSDSRSEYSISFERSGRYQLIVIGTILNDKDLTFMRDTIIETLVVKSK